MLLAVLIAVPAYAHTSSSLQNGTFDKEIRPWAVSIDEIASFDWRLADDASGSASSRSVEIGIGSGAVADRSAIYECISVDAKKLYFASARGFIPLDQRAADVGARLVLRWFRNAECSGDPITPVLAVASVSKAGVWTDLILRGQTVPEGATHVAFTLETTRTYRQGPSTRARFDDAAWVGAGDRLVIPGIASLRGAAASEWSSDLHLVNQGAVGINATLFYRCLAGGPCNTRPREVGIPPGEAVVMKDAAALFFQSPDTGGGVEILSDGAPGQLVATSRLNSRAPRGTFGANVPAVAEKDFAIGTVFPGVRNGPDFRTNLGIFNPQDSFIEVSIYLYAGGQLVASKSLLRVEAQSLVQMNVFDALGFPQLVTDNAYIRIGTRHGPVVPFISIIDNATNDVAFSTGVKQF
jgi:hypothetical protein